MIEKITKSEIIEQEHKVQKVQQELTEHKIHKVYQAPIGIQGPPGPSIINSTNVYTNIGPNNTSIFTRSLGSSVALCDPGDTALSGSFKVGQVGTPSPGSLPAIPLLISKVNRWLVKLDGILQYVE